MLGHRRAASLIALPIATASWLSAHCLGYVLVPPHGGEHMQHYAEDGHAWFGSMPVFIAAGMTLLAIGLVLGVGEGLRGGPRSGAPLGLFALLPPVGFVVQEHLEQLIASGSFPVALAVDPSFLMGLALQLPFALLALLLTRGLYALGYCLGRLLAGPVPCVAPAHGASALTGPEESATRFRPPVLALGHGPRAPPAVACP